MKYIYIYIFQIVSYKNSTSHLFEATLVGLLLARIWVREPALGRTRVSSKAIHTWYFRWVDR